MKIAVIIPCFRVRDHIIDVINKIDSNISKVYCVDDACPDQSGKFIEESCKNSNIRVLYNKKNGGVGSASKLGFSQAINDGMDILIKLDGDGQMNPQHIPLLIKKLLNGQSDLCKGNRFYNQNFFRIMPIKRIIGNAILSFMIKLTTGYWNIVDPTNGFFAIHSSVYKEINPERIRDDFLFETSILFNLSLLGAVVTDIPIKAFYGSEKSSLRINKVILPFFKYHFLKFHKRIIVIHFLRGFSVASLELLVGSILLLFGLTYGFYKFFQDFAEPYSISAGQVMLASLPIIIGIQFLVSFLRHDYSIQPKIPINESLKSLNN
jgi:dolichol-phosphate mannosyltransferase